MNNIPVSTSPSTDPILVARNNKWFEQIRQREDEKRKALSVAKQSLPCRYHPEQLRPLVIEQCDRNHDGTWRLSYRPCEHCVEEKALSKAGVPSNLFHCTLDNWEAADADDPLILSRVKEFKERQRGFLILCGNEPDPTTNVGTGKSHLAVAVLRGFPRGGRFITQSGFLRALRETYRDDHAEDIVNACKSAALLVLDEVGLSGGGRDELPALHDVLDHRYGDKRPTILTSNLDWPGIQNVFGPRMADRLTECATVLTFHGESHRRERREAYLSAGTQRVEGVQS